jgi:hypothetical protein
MFGGFMKRSVVVALAGATMLLASSASWAASVETFDTPPVGWITDRYQPAGFTSPVVFDGDNRLEHTISSADGASGRPSGFSSSFYNTQGMQRANPGGTNVLSVDMFVSSGMLADTGRVSGLWGVGFDPAHVVSAYPIVELFNGGFQGWDDANGWVSMGALPGLTGNQWVHLAIALDTLADTFTYTVDGQLATTVSALGTSEIGATILQLINTDTGINRTVYWDNLAASQVPVPAALPLFASGLGVIGFFARRRNQKRTAA